MTVHLAAAGNAFGANYFLYCFFHGGTWVGSGIELCLFLKIFLFRDESLLSAWEVGESGILSHQNFYDRPSRAKYFVRTPPPPR